MPLFIASDRADSLAREAMVLSHAKSKREAVERALIFFINHEKGKIPLHEKIAKIQNDFKQMIGKKAADKIIWSEEDKKKFFDELSGDE